MRRWTAVLVFAATCAAFSSALGAGFVNLDDDANFVHNQGFRGLGRDEWAWMFTTGHMGHFQPLTWLTFGVDHALWGLDGPRYHASSILLHGVSAVAFFLLAVVVFERVRPAAPRARHTLAAGLAALVFAVHPLRAESVAWVTGRNDVVAGLFLVLAAAAWVRWAPTGSPGWRAGPALVAALLSAAGLVLFLASVDRTGTSLALRGPGPLGLALATGCVGGAVVLIPRAVGRRGDAARGYVLACLCVALSLLGKAYAVVAPALFLVLDVWPLRRTGTRPRSGLPVLVLEKLPLLALSAAFAVLATWAKSSPVRALRTLSDHDPLERLLQAAYGLAFYPYKTLVPTGLIPMVDLPAEIRLADPRFLLPALAVVAVTALLVRVRVRWPALLGAWAAYVVLALPVLGLVQAGAQLVADRYSYAACMPLALLAGGGWLVVERGRVLAPLVAALPVLLGVLTWRQAALWRDSETIHAHGIEVGRSPRLVTNLAMMANERASAEPARAAEHFARALALSDRALALAAERDLFVPELLLHRGTILFNLGRLDEAVSVLGRYVAARPDNVQGLFNLGLALNGRGRFADAVPPLERATVLAPEETDPWRHLGLAYEGVARYADAGAAYARALELVPGQPMAAEGLRRVRARTE